MQKLSLLFTKDGLQWHISKGKSVLQEASFFITEETSPNLIEEKLDEILSGLGKKVDLVINLVTPKEEIIDRMLTRRVCTNQECKATYNTKLHPPKVEGICDKCGSPLKQRDDDSNPEAIKRRLEIYEEKTAPLVEYYQEKGVLKTETVSISINRMGKDVAEEVVESFKNK